MKGSKGNMILKIDMEKAFDIIEWYFIIQALHFFNFSPKLSKLIISCISTTFIFVLLNRAKSPFF